MSKMVFFLFGEYLVKFYGYVENGVKKQKQNAFEFMVTPLFEQNHGLGDFQSKLTQN